jgi:DNA-binding transcriptional ArsR family regulator
LAKHAPDLIDPRLTKAYESPTRAEILSVLHEEGPSSPTRVARRLPNVSLKLVSHHIKVLRETGYVELVETVEKRGATEHIYRTTTPRFLDVHRWSQLDQKARQSLTVTILRKISSDTARALAEGKFDERLDNHLTHTTLNLDEEGWEEVRDILVQTLEAVIAADAKSAERIAASGEGSTAATVAMMHFPVPAEGEAGDSAPGPEG